VDDPVSIGPLVEIRVDGGRAPQPETTYEYGGAHRLLIITGPGTRENGERNKREMAKEEMEERGNG
jgi:hypothetical protein